MCLHISSTFSQPYIVLFCQPTSWESGSSLSIQISLYFMLPWSPFLCSQKLANGPYHDPIIDGGWLCHIAVECLLKSLRPSVCPHETTGVRIFIKFYVRGFTKICHYNFCWNPTKITNTLREDLDVFMCAEVTGWGIPRLLCLLQLKIKGQIWRTGDICTLCERYSTCFI